VLDVSTGLFDLSCRNPVAVTAVISGTPEMWKRASGPLDDIAHVGMAVASTDAVRELQAGLATDPAAPIDPLLETPDPDPRPPADPTVKATFRRQDPSGLPYGGIPSFTGSGSPDTAIHTVSGSIQDWRSSWIPIVVRFQADWVKRRTLGSCYVLLPELTGTPWGALSAAVRASGHGADVADEEAAKRVAASHGYISLSTSADIVGEESDPRPAVLPSGESSSVWTCSSSPHALSAGRPDLPRSPSGTGLALPNDQRLRDESGSNCGGFAVLSTAPSQLLRELSLITIAVLISMIIEIAYSEVRGRRP
jgi:hypothetical protein